MIHHTEKRFHIFTKLSFTSHRQFCFRCTLMCACTCRGWGRGAVGRTSSLLHFSVLAELNQAAWLEENTLLCSIHPVRSCLKISQHWIRTLETQRKRKLRHGWVQQSLPTASAPRRHLRRYNQTPIGSSSLSPFKQKFIFLCNKAGSISGGLAEGGSGPSGVGSSLEGLAWSLAGFSLLPSALLPSLHSCCHRRGWKYD